jgi:U32 family peptidase
MTTTTDIRPFRPELLAPAGGIDSFHAAVDAGADAVYLGLDGFNARLRAKNFTAKTLSHLVPYAHGKKRKIYVTLNTLVKQAELEQCVHVLFQLEQLRVDAVIVQDLGVAHICRRSFPALKVHASTQMAVHNSLGVRAAGDMGIKRVVLARELTFEEIAAIRGESPVELETFVHGALCYSLSGMCLASSFLGGFSGNRGRCTQVCRRPFLSGGGTGHYFSPADFCALQYLDRYRDIGIDSLKIEGRMKNEEYVFAVVSAYRRAIDDPSCAAALLDRMDFDLGRKKSAFFLGGVVQEGIIDPSGPSGTGIPLGAIEHCGGREIAIPAQFELSAGDGIRIQPLSGFEGKNYRIEKTTNYGGRCVIELKEPVPCGVGDMVYLTRRASGDRKAAGERTVSGQELRFSRFYPKVNELIGSYAPKKRHPPAQNKPALTVIIDDPGWRGLIFPDLVDGLVAAYGKNDAEKYFLREGPAQAWKNKIALAIPPFVAQEDIGFWRGAVHTSAQRGVRRLMCSGVGQWLLAGDSMAVTGDYWIWCFNRAAQRALFDRGVGNFSYSPEDDFPNMKNAAASSGTAILFARVPLFISRVRPGIPAGEACCDAAGNRFVVVEKHGLYYLVSEKPLCLFHKRRKLEEAGISSFAIDLRFCKPDKNLFKQALRCFNQETRIEGSGTFNFKLGLR